MRPAISRRFSCFFHCSLVGPADCIHRRGCLLSGSSCFLHFHRLILVDTLFCQAPLAFRERHSICLPEGGRTLEAKLVALHFDLTLHTQENSGKRDKQFSPRSVVEAAPVKALRFDRIALDNSTRWCRGTGTCHRCRIDWCQSPATMAWSDLAWPGSGTSGSPRRRTRSIGHPLRSTRCG